MAKPAIEMEKSRLRCIVDRVTRMGEVEVHEEPVRLPRLDPIIGGKSKAVLFRKAGPEQVGGLTRPTWRGSKLSGC